MSVHKFSLIIGCVFALVGCISNGEESKKPITRDAVIVPNIKDKHVNISVVVDLSNRIDANLHPEQASRDIAVIQNLSQIFKKNIDAFGAFKANAKFRVFFNPEPQDPQMSELTKSLIAECQAGTKLENVKHNKALYATVDGNLANGLQKYILSPITKMNIQDRIFGGL